MSRLIYVSFMVYVSMNMYQWIFDNKDFKRVLTLNNCMGLILRIWQACSDLGDVKTYSHPIMNWIIVKTGHKNLLIMIRVFQGAGFIFSPVLSSDSIFCIQRVVHKKVLFRFWSKTIPDNFWTRIVRTKI